MVFTWMGQINGRIIVLVSVAIKSLDNLTRLHYRLCKKIGRLGISSLGHTMSSYRESIQMYLGFRRLRQLKIVLTFHDILVAGRNLERAQFSREITFKKNGMNRTRMNARFCTELSLTRPTTCGRRPSSCPPSWISKFCQFARHAKRPRQAWNNVTP